LNLEVKDEVMDVEEKIEDDDTSLSGGEEEWPSVKSISGLELSRSQSSPELSKPKSPSSSAIEDVSESSSLGELRFQDE